MATNGGVGALLQKVGALFASMARGVRWAVTDMPRLVWTWLLSNAARVVAVVWLAGLGVFVTVASIRTYETMAAEAKVERAREARQAKQRQAISKLEFMDVDEMHGQNDRRLAQYGKEFQSMLPDAGPPGAKPVKKEGGIGGWIKRNKKHANAKISDKETLKLLRKEMGAEFGALEELADTGGGGGIQGTMRRMKVISKIRGGKGSRVPSKELIKEMSTHGFDRHLMGTAKPGDGDAKAGDGASKASDGSSNAGAGDAEAGAGKPPVGEQVAEGGTGSSKGQAGGTAKGKQAASAAQPAAQATISSERFDVEALGGAATSAFGPALEAIAASLGNANGGKATKADKAKGDKANGDKAKDSKARDTQPGRNNASGGK